MSSGHTGEGRQGSGEAAGASGQVDESAETQGRKSSLAQDGERGTETGLEKGTTGDEGSDVRGQQHFARAGLSDRPSECVDLDTWSI